MRSAKDILEKIEEVETKLTGALPTSLQIQADLAKMQTLASLEVALQIALLRESRGGPVNVLDI